MTPHLKDLARGAVAGGVLFDVALASLLAWAALAVGVGSEIMAWHRQADGGLPIVPMVLAALGASALHFTGTGPRARNAHIRSVLLLIVTLPLAYALFGLIPSLAHDSRAVQAGAVAGIAVLVIRRLYVSHRSLSARGQSRILIFGAGAAAEVVGNTLRAADPGARIVGFVPGPNETEAVVPAQHLLACPDSLAETANRLGVDEIVVALTERRAGSMPLRQLLDCKLSGIKVYDLNSHFEKTLGQIRIDYLNASWLIFGDGFNQGTLRTFVKRVFDIVCSALLFLVSAPIMLVTALLIRLESPGPVFYRQERVGQNGRTFFVNKFRSMRNDAEKDGKPRWAAANDDRVTRVGQFIRRTRIDELPQLFNVLKGEMSLVGPRPERPYFVEQLTQKIPFYAVRHSVKPGVTGWAQVRYAYGATVEDSQEKLQFDLYYVKNHTLLLDLLVLLETVGVVVTGKGAR